MLTTIEQLEAYVSSPAYDSATAGLLALSIPALKAAAGQPGELLEPGVRRIRGNLCNVHGRYGPCDKGAAGKPKKPKKGRAPKKPPKVPQTPAQRAQARTQTRQANIDDVAKRMAQTDTGLGPSGSRALSAFAQGQQPSPAIGDAFVKGGLAEQSADGSFRMTPTGRAVINAMAAGDYQRAIDGLARAADTVGKRTERQTAQQARQADSAKRQQDAAGKRATAQVGRELAARQRAEQAKKKPSSGGSKKPDAGAEKPLRSSAPKRLTRNSAPSVGGVAGAAGNAPKPKPVAAPTPEKAPAKQIAPALQAAADQLSQGAELSDEDTLALIRNGLAKLNKDGALILTAAGMRATQKSYRGVFQETLQPHRSVSGTPQRKRLASTPSKATEKGVSWATQVPLKDALGPGADQGRWRSRLVSNVSGNISTSDFIPPIISPSFTVFKDAAGRDRWVAQSSTAFQDRDREIVSTKALTDDVAYADETRAYGPLRWWHTPGLDLGDCDFNAMHGRVLIESGTFRTPRIAQKVAAASSGLEISLGFVHLPNEPDADGVFHHIRRFERSLVPRGKASNRFTAFTVKETRMFDPTKIAALKQLGFSDEDITGLQTQADQTEKAATAEGVAFKADEPLDLPDLEINGVIYKAFPPKAAAATAAAEETVVEEVVEEDAFGDEPMVEEAAPEAGGLTLSPEDLAAIGETFGAAITQALTPLMGLLDIEKKMQGHVESLMSGYQKTKDAEHAQTKEQLDALAGKVNELTGDQAQTPYRASAAKDNVLTDATMLAAAKQLSDPNAADPWADIKLGLGLSRPQ